MEFDTVAEYREFQNCLDDKRHQSSRSGIAQLVRQDSLEQHRQRLAAAAAERADAPMPPQSNSLKGGQESCEQHHQQLAAAAAERASAAAPTQPQSNSPKRRRDENSPQAVAESKEDAILKALRMMPREMFQYEAPNHDGYGVFGFACEDTRRASRKRARATVLERLAPVTGVRPAGWQLSEEAWYRGYSGRPYIAPMAWNQMIRTEMAAVRERAEYVPGPLFAMLADRIAHVSASSPPYGPEHAAKEIAKAEATLAALHVAVGGLECYRFEVPDYHYVEEEAGVCLLAGYCFVGDGYLVGWYDKALLIS